MYRVRLQPSSARLLTAAESTGKVAALAAVDRSFVAASGALGALFTNFCIVERRTGEDSFDLTGRSGGRRSSLWND
jgi:hypothetical protein